MLALTSNATDAIEGILSAPSIPDGAGVRIATTAGELGEEAAGRFQVTVAEGPAETDCVIDEQGARVFVDDAVAEYLDDKLLDASISDQRVSFAISEQPH